jgi:hypothetical protein
MARKPFPTTRGPAFGTLREIFPDVWWVGGTTQFAPFATFPRNMIVLREPDGLVLVHPVMLPEAEQARLEAMGPIRHIVRLGDFHGMDDALYVERYAPTVWAPPGVMPVPGVRADRELVQGGPSPVADGTVVSFTKSKVPEVVLHLARHGGALAACDSVQNWEHRPEGCSWLGSLLAVAMGLKGRSCLGPGWLREAEEKGSRALAGDYARILDLDFRHLLAAHGPPVLDTARDDLRVAVTKRYG